jgi:hypothetical protein
MSDKVTMTALDTLHISSVHADNLVEGDTFRVSEADAKHLESMGVAERGGSASKAVNAEASESSRPDTREELDAERGEAKAIVGAPANKMQAASENKTVFAASSSRGAAKRKGK